MPWPSLVTSQLPDLSGRRFLIVEDDHDSRGFLGELLRACRAVVVEAESVRQAKAFVETIKFDLIVTDLAMPGEDGAMFLTWLREQPRDQGGLIPAVVVTAFHEQYPPDQVNGWAAYFRKPLKLEDFIATIAKILDVPDGKPKR